MKRQLLLMTDGGTPETQKPIYLILQTISKNQKSLQTEAIRMSIAIPEIL